MVNFLVLCLLTCIIATVIYLHQCRTRRSPQRAKERIAELSRSAPTRNLMALQADLRKLSQDLSSQDLVLNNATDHNNRADAYRLLAELQVNLMQFIDAEKNFRAAIDAYNDALKLEADNR